MLTIECVTSLGRRIPQISNYLILQILKVPVWEDIRQLIVSPNGDLMAIVTSHTIHVAILPDPSHLRSPDTSPIRLKAYTVGSTTHILSKAPLVSAVWHPLGVSGHCLVTSTSEAIVRLWEFDLENRWSFDSPRLTIDLKRLADGLPHDEEQRTSRLSSSKMFSPDVVDMEVAATSFGGLPSRSQDPWAPMTFWIAMREGDVYALCPLLPTKWAAPAGWVQSLTAHISSKLALATSEPERQMFEKQLDWATEVESQQPVSDHSEGLAGQENVLYRRPEELGPVPKLQGPLEPTMLPQDDLEFKSLVTDIYAIPATIAPERQSAGYSFGSGGESLHVEGLSLGVVCLLTSTGRVHVLLDSEGVQDQWPSAQEVRA